MPDIKPPLAFLSAQSGTQDAAIGTFCWNTEERGLCADAIGLPVPDMALAVNQGEQLIFSMPGFEQLVNVEVNVYDYAHTEIEKSDLSERMILYPVPEAIEIPFRNDVSMVTLTADLPPGQYVISVHASVPGPTFQPVAPNPTATTVHGGATYGFYIEVGA